MNFEEFLQQKFPEAKRSGNGWQAHCPAHPDHNPSLSINEGSDDRVLLKCHAGCSTESILSALGLSWKDLFQNSVNGAPTTPGTIVATYPYQDADGNLLFESVRYAPKDFRFRRPGGERGWIWKLKGTSRVLFRLPKLASADPDTLVYVVEGEKDVLALEGVGLLATTNSGGAGKWREEYNQVLEDRDVVVIPDNDEPGHNHAEQVANQLSGCARTVRIVELPESGGKDTHEWLANGGTPDELERLALDTAEWEPQPADAESLLEEDDAGRKENVAQTLVRLAIEADVELFHDQRDDAYVRVPLGSGRRILSMKSRKLTSWIRHLAWDRLRKPIGRETVSTVRDTLACFAQTTGPQHHLWTRHARHDGAIWIDVDGIRAIRVDESGWEIVEQPPILFRYFPHQKPLPVPAPNGSPRDVLRFVRIDDPDVQILFLSYLVAAFVPDVPIAALIAHGVQGSTKSTLLKVVKRMLDPSLVEVRGGVRDQTEFAQAAFQNRVLFFDNLTNCPEWLSDALCRTVTGEGWSKRSLFTDEDSTVFVYRGVVGLAGINVVASRADLLDRSLIILMDPVPENERRAELGFWKEFADAEPSILGGLLNALSGALAIEPSLTLDRLPRMADFARYGEAAARALGYQDGAFLRAFDANVGRQNEAAIEASPVAQAVLSFMEERDDWEGTPSELLEELEKVASTLRINTKSKEWPKNPNWVTRRIRDVQPNLLAIGIQFGYRPGTKRRVELERVRVGRDEEPPGSYDDNLRDGDGSGSDVVTRNTMNNNGSGGTDGSDTNPVRTGGGTSKAYETSSSSEYEFDERAGVREFDGGRSPSEAELRAREDLKET